MTPQEIFDRVVEHIHTQGRPARRKIGNSDSCGYRTDAGLKCAAGCLIADEHYSPGLEGQTAFCQDVVGAIECTIGVPLDYLERETISDLQQAHDFGSSQLSNTEWRASFDRRARELARECGLNPSALERFPWSPEPTNG